ncbi:uncharacterized protein [Miscanthus floridulus]|uniref:uncharacterized protein n=1 Tax=Miscanthus floridulus TaxID=154761 RepID=UPI00345A630D
MGEEKKKLSISIVCKRRPHKTSSLFAAIDDAPSSAPAPEPARQYVAEFDPSQGLTPAVAPVVIAPLPNLGIFGRRKPSPLLAAPCAAAAGLAAFAVDSATSTATADPSSSTHYGLTRLDAADASDRGTDEFSDMPVEGFGVAICRTTSITIVAQDTGLAIIPLSPTRIAGGLVEKGLEHRRFARRRIALPGARGLVVEKGIERKLGRSRETAGAAARCGGYRATSGSGLPARSWANDLYLTKGKVVDVVSPTTCDVVMDDGLRLVQGVEQDMLETVLPRTNGLVLVLYGEHTPTTCDVVMDVGLRLVQGVEQDMLETVPPQTNGLVLVLYGEHRGVRGRLVVRNAEEEVGLVEDVETKGVIRVGYDQMAEFTGALE